MFRALTIAGVAGIPPRTYALDPKGRTDIAGPSGSGKSTLAHAICVLLAGDAVNRTRNTDNTASADVATITGTTAKGTILGVSATAKGSTWSRDGAALATRADYMQALGKWGGDIPALIVAPMRWRELAAGTGEPLAKMIARILPAGDVPARVRSIMGDHHRDGDPCDVPGALAAQKLANGAQAAAAERATRARLALAAAEKARADIAAPLPDEVDAAEATLAADAAWVAYDRDTRAWTAYDTALTAWTAAAIGEAPAFDAAAHQAARVKVDNLTAQIAKEEREAAVAEAKRQAEAKAERDAEIAKAKAEADAAAAVARATEAARIAEAGRETDRLAAEARQAAADAKARAEVAPSLFSRPAKVDTVDGWPRSVDVYISREWNESEEYGKTIKAWGWAYEEDRGRMLGGLGYEHKITYSVGPDGVGTATHLDGRAVAPESK